MHDLLRTLVAALALAAPLLSFAQTDESVPFTLELVGTSPSGDALLIRERYHPGDGEACPAKSYPKVKGRCNLGILLDVCKPPKGCSTIEVYAVLSGDAEPTSESKAAANLAEAKKQAAAAGIILSESPRELLPAPGSLFSAEGLPDFSIVQNDEEQWYGMDARAGGFTVSLGYLGHHMQGDWKLSAFVTPDRSVLVTYALREGWSEWQLSAVRVRSLGARFLELRARGRYEKKDWAGAARDYAAAVEHDPGHATAGVGLGLSQLRLGKRAEAAAALQRAVAAGARPPESYGAVLEPSLAESP